MSAVGVVVNPHAGRDVRRLTSLARAVGAHDRVNTTARVLAGLAAAGVTDVVYMPEPARTVERALAVLSATGRAALQATPVGDVPAGDAAATSAAAGALRAHGVVCVVTVGGDGTHRAVFRGWPDGVLVPVPGGTNNAVAPAVQPGSAGLAAGRFALAPTALAAHVHRRPCLEVAGASIAPTVALADVAVTANPWVGAHALWEPGLLDEIVLARSDPTVPGLVGLGGMLVPLDDGRGLHLRLGGSGRRVLAPLGPGQFATVTVAACRVVAVGARVTLHPADRRRALAFDGERETTLAGGALATVTVASRGPRMLDVGGVLRATAAGC